MLMLLKTTRGTNDKVNLAIAMTRSDLMGRVTNAQ